MSRAARRCRRQQAQRHAWHAPAPALRREFSRPGTSPTTRQDCYARKKRLQHGVRRRISLPNSPKIHRRTYRSPGRDRISLPGRRNRRRPPIKISATTIVRRARANRWPRILFVHLVSIDVIMRIISIPRGLRHEVGLHRARKGDRIVRLGCVEGQ